MLQIRQSGIFLIILLVLVQLNVFSSYSQYNEADSVDTYDVQDSILNRITDISSFLEKENTGQDSYIKFSEENNLRYFNSDIPDLPGSYMDIIKNPEYETLGYTVTFKDTMIIDPMFMPILFTGKVLPRKLNFPQYDDPYNRYVYQYPVIRDPQLFRKELYNNELRRKAVLNVVVNHPELIKYVKNELPEPEKPQELEVNIFKDLFQVENNPSFDNLGSPDKYDPGRIYWFFKGNSLLQFSQNYVSGNWYKGGVTNISILSNQVAEYNYSKDKIRFNNKLEWNLNLLANKNDSSFTPTIGTDLLRTYSDFGLQAFGSRWYYSTNLELKTQVMNNYRENPHVLVSSFAAPFFVNMGILGMKYSLDKSYKDNKHKKLYVNADISPLSVKYTLIANSKIDSTIRKNNYGISDGKNSLTQFGSSINATFTMNFNRQVSFSSRFKYFTTYEKMEVESENTLDMRLNRYFSTRLYLYVRFDDSNGIAEDKVWKYVQVNELLSFGFNFKW